MRKLTIRAGCLSYLAASRVNSRPGDGGPQAQRSSPRVRGCRSRIGGGSSISRRAAAQLPPPKTAAAHARGTQGPAASWTSADRGRGEPPRLGHSAEPGTASSGRSNPYLMPSPSRLSLRPSPLALARTPHRGSDWSRVRAAARPGSAPGGRAGGLLDLVPGMAPRRGPCSRPRCGRRPHQRHRRLRKPRAGDLAAIWRPVQVSRPGRVRRPWPGPRSRPGPRSSGSGSDVTAVAPPGQWPALCPPSICRVSPVMNGDDSRNRMPSTMSLTWPTLPRGCSPASSS
jgi:hypothetical protein